MTAPLKVSIVMGFFGELDSLKETLLSISEQDLPQFELVIVDDGNMPAVREEWVREFIRSGIALTLVRIGFNRGLSFCLRIGCAVAKGSIIARIDAGDLMVPTNRLSLQLDYLENNPRVGIVGGQIILVDTRTGQGLVSKGSKRKAATQATTKYSNTFYHVTVAFQKDAYMKCGGYDSTWQTGQDSELWIRMLRRTRGCTWPCVFAIAPMAQQSISVSRNRRQILGKVKRILIYPSLNGSRSFGFRRYSYVFVECLKLLLPTSLRLRLQYWRHYFVVSKSAELKDSVITWAVARRRFSNYVKGEKN